MLHKRWMIKKKLNDRVGEVVEDNYMFSNICLLVLPNNSNTQILLYKWVIPSNDIQVICFIFFELELL
jgi:hypothetical protein